MCIYIYWFQRGFQEFCIGLSSVKIKAGVSQTKAKVTHDSLWEVITYLGTTPQYFSWDVTWSGFKSTRYWLLYDYKCRDISQCILCANYLMPYLNMFKSNTYISKHSFLVAIWKLEYIKVTKTSKMTPFPPNSK